ncbi:MAG: hypothetical protein ACOCQL_04165 [Halolamina sp.]
MPEDTEHGWQRRGVLQGTGALGVGAATPGRDPGAKESEVLVGVSATADGVAATVKQYVPGDAELVHENETLR